MFIVVPGNRSRYGRKNSDRITIHKREAAYGYCKSKHKAKEGVQNLLIDPETQIPE